MSRRDSRGSPSNSRHFLIYFSHCNAFLSRALVDLRTAKIPSPIFRCKSSFSKGIVSSLRITADGPNRINSVMKLSNVNAPLSTVSTPIHFNYYSLISHSFIQTMFIPQKNVMNIVIEHTIGYGELSYNSNFH